MKLKRWSIPAATAAVALVIAGTSIAQGPGPMKGDRGWGMWGAWGMWQGGGPHWWGQ